MQGAYGQAEDSLDDAIWAALDINEENRPKALDSQIPCEKTIATKDAPNEVGPFAEAVDTDRLNGEKNSLERDLAMPLSEREASDRERHRTRTSLSDAIIIAAILYEKYSYRITLHKKAPPPPDGNRFPIKV